jgi:hypothetical protein
MPHADGHPAAHFNITPQTIHLMNTAIRPLLSLLALAALCPQFASAQGSLTPPAGPPVASMKTLDQVEARKAVQSLSATAPYTISAPGSYYLTGNITVATGDAIVIASNDVSLDLNGFTIRSTFTGGSSGTAISVSSGTYRLRVRNGSIVSGTDVPASGPAVEAGFAQGIYSTGAISQCLVSEVHVTGVAGWGIVLDLQGVVERCMVRNCGNIGISATEVQNCSAENCLHTGIFSGGNATNCSGVARDVNGIYCTNATNCIGASTRGGFAGLSCLGNATSCSGTSTSGTGLYCLGNAINCSGTSTSSAGLVCERNATNCSGTSASSTGLYCTGNAANCSGTSTSSAGLVCTGNAANCTGSSTSGTNGMSVTGTASFCRSTRAGGVAIIAANAIGCTSGGGSISAPLKSLGTP